VAFLGGHSFCLAVPLDSSVYIGTAITDRGLLMTYKLVFIDSNNILKGYSVMNVNTGSETIAELTGTSNESATQLVFKERKVLKTNDSSSNQFCFLQGSLKAKSFKGTKVLKGHFEGYVDNTDTLCVTGKLTLLCPKDALKLLNKVPEDVDSVYSTENHAFGHKKTSRRKSILNVGSTTDSAVLNQRFDSLLHKLLDSKDDAGKAVQSPLQEKVEEIPKNVLKIHPGGSVVIESKATSAEVEIWDNRDVDGDIVTLMHGDKAIIKNYEISNDRISLPVGLNGNINDTLRIVAVSEGSEPPNTARLKITAGSDVYFIDAETTIDKEVLIVFRKK